MFVRFYNGFNYYKWFRVWVTNDGILSKENYLEFKSADDIDAKPMRFAQKVANTV